MLFNTTIVKKEEAWAQTHTTKSPPGDLPTPLQVPHCQAGLSVAPCYLQMPHRYTSGTQFASLFLHCETLALTGRAPSVHFS